MGTFDFRRGSNQRLVHWIKLDRELFEQAKRIHSFGRAHASLHDIEEFPPIDPVEDRASAGFFVVVQAFLNDLPAGLRGEKD
jgi:hypothetical protein